MGTRLKAIVAACCAFALCGTLAACGGDSGSASSASSEAASSSSSSSAKSSKNYNERFAGTYDLVSYDGDDGPSAKELKKLQEAGEAPYIVLKESGKFRYYSEDGNVKGSFEAESRHDGTIDWDGVEGTIELDDDELTIVLEDDTEMVFALEDEDAVAGLAASGIGGDASAASEPEPEPEPAVEPEPSSSSAAAPSSSTVAGIDPYVGDWLVTSMFTEGDPDSSFDKETMAELNELGLYVVVWIEDDGSAALVMLDIDDPDNPDITYGEVDPAKQTITFDDETLNIKVNGTEMTIDDGETVMTMEYWE